MKPEKYRRAPLASMRRVPENGGAHPKCWLRMFSKVVLPAPFAPVTIVALG